MGWLIVCLVAVIFGQLIYIRHLRKEIECHLSTWKQIGDIADHNEDGDVVIHTKHMDM